MQENVKISKIDKKRRKKHYAYKKACEILSASSTRTSIFIW